MAIVVDIEEDGAGGTGDEFLAEDERGGVGGFPELGVEAAAGEEGLEVLGVFGEAGEVAVDVGEGDEVVELAEDGGLVLEDVGFDVGGLGEGGGGEEEEEEGTGHKR